jgi:hypothetical protein
VKGGALVQRKAMTGLALALLVCVGACATPSVTLSQGPREYVPSDYERILLLWTRSGELVTLAALNDILSVSATFESWDFRWAYSLRYAKDHQYLPEQTRALRDAALVDTGAHHQFFVALYGSSNARWMDISRPNSAWTVRLIDDKGNQTAPEEIVPIIRPGADERAYYPYASQWRRLFRIKFPASTATGPTIATDANFAGLRFAGALGTLELHWDLAR